MFVDMGAVLYKFYQQLLYSKGASKISGTLSLRVTVVLFLKSNGLTPSIPQNLHTFM